MSFLKKKSLNSSLEIIGALVQACALRGGPLCQQLLKLWMDRDYLGIMDFVIEYSDPTLLTHDVLYARQIMGLLQKQDFIDLGIDKQAAALEKFKDSEKRCRLTNIRFRNNIRPENGRVDEVLYLTQRKINDILGPVPSIADIAFSFGPGTNTSTKMGRACPRAKLSSKLECNTNMSPFCWTFLVNFQRGRIYINLMSPSLRVN